MTDHRAWADKQGGGNGNFTAVEHLLAALHDGQREHLEVLRGMADSLLALRKAGDTLGPRESSEPSCGRGCHSIEQGCPVHDPAALEPSSESVTVSLPRDVVELYGAKDWRFAAQAHRIDQFPVTADLLDALADALDAASATQEAEAWDEGFDAGHQAARAVNPEWPEQSTNPYRIEADQ